MTPPAALTGPHLRTYQSIFQHPVPPHLGWNDVHALFRQLGQVEAGPDGNLKVTRNGQTLVLPAARAKDVAETDELMALRHFLEQTESARPAANGKEAQWLLIIDHHEARIYRSVEPGAVPQLIRPHAPEDFFRHAPHSKDFSRGQEKPDPNSFFEPVAAVLKGAGSILIFGSGTGTASEMDQFVAWLKQHRPEPAKRIIGTVVVDGHHQTEGQLLVQAREFFTAHRLPPP